MRGSERASDRCFSSPMTELGNRSHVATGSSLLDLSSRLCLLLLQKQARMSEECS